MKQYQRSQTYGATGGNGPFITVELEYTDNLFWWKIEL